MARGAHSNGVFIASSVTSIANNDTAVDVTDFTSLVVPVWDVEKLIIQGLFTGGAGAAGAVVFNLVGRIKDAGTWDTTIAYVLTMARDGTAAVLESGQIDVRGHHSIKLYSVAVADGTAAITTVNLNWGKSYPWRR